MQKNEPEKSRRDENTEATRHALLLAGRELFADMGYQATGIEAISKAARLTRGAFYHHFEDKKALFDAVVVSMQAEAAIKIGTRAKAERNVWSRLSIGIDAYLDASVEPDYRRIVIQEAPAILGDGRYGEIEETYPLAHLIATLKALKRQGEINFDDIDLLSRMIDAMICKMAVMLSESDDPVHLRSQGQQIIDSLLSCFRRT